MIHNRPRREGGPPACGESASRCIGAVSCKRAHLVAHQTARSSTPVVDTAVAKHAWQLLSTDA